MKSNDGGKVPEYQKRAINKYKNKFRSYAIMIDKEKDPDVINLYKSKGFNSLNQYINFLLDQELQKEPAPDQSGPVEGCPF